MKNVTKMSHEDLLIKFESLVIRFVKEDDFGLDVTRTNEEIELVKDEILTRLLSSDNKYRI